uniref:TATA box-binding protein-like 1 n=1 Tax=Globodera rostochiensis TaxID=31243 RepID=A0A914H012_GLORO
MDHNYWQTCSNNQLIKQSEQNGSVLEKARTSSQTSGAANQLHVVFMDGIEVCVQVHNVVSRYELPMHIDLRQVAYGSINVDYNRAKGILNKQLRKPSCSVKIFNSGKVVIHGCKSENDCKRVARAIGRMIQRSTGRLDQRICIRNYRVSNILATCRMPFDIRIQELGRKYREAVYEPELMVGLEWNLREPKANLRIHTTGTVTITGATSEANIVASVEKIYPFLKEFSTQRSSSSKINIDSAWLGDSTKSRRRRCPQPKNDLGVNNSNEQRSRPIPTKRSRYQHIQGSGFYNNAIHNSDEDDLEFGDVDEGDEDYEDEEDDIE